MSQDLPTVAAPPPPPAAGRMARNALHLALGQATSMVLSMVLSAALGRALGAADFGVLYLVSTMSTFAYVVCEWGQATYLVREVARHPQRTGSLLGAALAFRGGGALLVGALGALAAWLLGYDARTQHLYLLLTAAYLPLACSLTFAHVFRGHERMDHDALLTVTAKLLTVGLTLPALLLGGRIAAAMVAQGVAGLVTLSVAVWLYRRRHLPPLTASGQTLRELASGGSPMFAMAFAVSVQPYLDAVVLSKLAPGDAVGWYGAARNFMNALTMPAIILAGAAYPALSRAAGDPALFARQLRAALRPVLLLGAFASAGTWLFADLAVAMVYGRDRFGPAIPILLVFAPALAILYLDVLMGNAILAAGRPKLLAATKSGAVLAGAALELALVPWFQAHHGNGGLGLVVALGATELVMLAAMVAMVPGGALDRGLARDAALALAVSSATVLVIRALYARPGLAALPGFALCFAALGLVTGLVRRDDLSALRGVVDRRRAAAADQSTSFRA